MCAFFNKLKKSCMTHFFYIYMGEKTEKSKTEREKRRQVKKRGKEIKTSKQTKTKNTNQNIKTKQKSCKEIENRA